LGRVPARRRNGHSGDTVSACWRRAVTRFASLYADQNELNYRRLQEAAAAGEIDALEGV
jgi:hypothetical protein